MSRDRGVHSYDSHMHTHICTYTQTHAFSLTFFSERQTRMRVNFFFLFLVLGSPIQSLAHSRQVFYLHTQPRPCHQSYLLFCPQQHTVDTWTNVCGLQASSFALESKLWPETPPGSLRKGSVAFLGIIATCVTSVCVVFYGYTSLIRLPRPHPAPTPKLIRSFQMKHLP